MIAQIKSLILELGYVSAASYLASRLLDKIFGIYMQHYKFYSQPTSTTPRVAASKLERYTFKWINKPDDILNALERPVEVIQERFDQGSVCLVATQQGSFQGCLWLVRTKYIEDEVRATYHFPDNAVWDYDVYIIPKKRITILFAALWDTADQWMKEHNVTNTLSRISAYNPQSVRSHETAGAKQIGWMIAIVIKHWQITLSSQSPRLHFSSKNNTAGPQLYFTKI